MRISDWSSDVCSSDLLAGDHLGRWTLRKLDLFHPKISETTKASLKSARVGDDDLEAAIMLDAGEGRGDYPLFSMADAAGNIVGVLMDFFLDNRPDRKSVV